MSQNKSLFFVATLASMILLCNNSAMADKLLCPSGKMVPANFEYCLNCTDDVLNEHMPAGTDFTKLYCPGGIFDFNKPEIQGIKYCADDKKPDEKRKKCEDLNTVAQETPTPQSAPISELAPQTPTQNEPAPVAQEQNVDNQPIPQPVNVVEQATVEQQPITISEPAPQPAVVIEQTQPEPVVNVETVSEPTPTVIQNEPMPVAQEIPDVNIIEESEPLVIQPEPTIIQSETTPVEEDVSIEEPVVETPTEIIDFPQPKVDDSAKAIVQSLESRTE